MKRLLTLLIAAVFATVGVSAFAADGPAPHHHRHHHRHHHHHHVAAPMPR